MEKGSFLTNSVIENNNGLKKSQSDINLEYMNQIAKLPGYTNQFLNDDYDTIINDKKYLENLEIIFNKLLDEVTELERNIEQEISWMNTELKYNILPSYNLTNKFFLNLLIFHV